MKKYYKVYTDFTTYIPIEENELEKAMVAFLKGSGAIFEAGATKRIEVIVPDNVRMMGWNAGYKPNAEDTGEIAHDRTCKSAKVFMAEIKDRLALGSGQPSRIYTNGPTAIGNLIKLEGETTAQPSHDTENSKKKSPLSPVLLDIHK